MNDLEILKKKILYRSNYRGTKEMDILLSSFTKFYIDKFNKNELIELNNFLNLEDELIYNVYKKRTIDKKDGFEKIFKLLKNFEI